MNNVKKKIYIVISSLLVILLPCLYVLIIQASQYNFDFTLAQEFFNNNTNIFWLSYVLVLTISLVLLSLIGNTIITEFLLFIVVVGLAFANNQKVLARDVAIYPEDIFMVREIKLLMTMIDRSELIKIVIVVLALVLVCILLFIAAKKTINLQFNKKIIYPLRGILLVFSVFVLFLFININEEGSTMNKIQKKMDIEFIDWSQVDNYRVNGFVLSFLNNSRVQPIKKPEGYSKDSVLKIVEKYKKIAKEQNQSKEELSDIDIVYVMSESFIDPSDTDLFYEKNEDPIPFTHELLQSSISGKALVPEYGGGTANMEFEALTSFSNYFLQVIPYQSVVPKINGFPSIVSYVKDRNYTATAIHPFDGNMYKRVEVYNSMGFDQFMDQKDMTYTDIFPPGGAISDESAFNQVYDVLTQDDKDHFVHLVTMQNHQPYSAGYDENPFEVTSDLLTDDIKVRMQIYFKGINQSDKAMEQFIEKIDQLDKKTMIVFWGDHYPGQGLFSDIDGEHAELVHSTPLFIYKNFDSEHSDIGSQSLNYLTPNVLNELNVKETPFHALVNTLNKEIKGLTKNIQLNSNSEQFELFNEDSYPTLKEYEIIHYDLIAGNKYSLKEKFYSIEN
ncbi:LTA synthase family protein [Carnobacterium divergens]|uniref:LTA synthase family protein n=1 Tax=Carnobacterium divergens TaxID=2748 RepID=UPI00107288A4|nr:LTA synthase family protein [Carnobacterium divergens]TFI75394.1 hypothetical protein CKN81_00735 [Carnobacterium divergens]